jgi:hypothetical protein
MNKKQFLKTEVFFLIGDVLQETGFSPRLTYLLFLRKFYRTFFISSNTKSINLHLKLSRSGFKFANNSATLTGYYRAV